MSDLLADADRIVRAEAARAARDPIVHVSWRLARNDPHYERLWRWGEGMVGAPSRRREAAIATSPGPDPIVKSRMTLGPIGYVRPDTWAITVHGDRLSSSTCHEF